MNFKILLVDDEETLRCVLKESLDGEGYYVDVANDGVQALEYIKIKQYDLLITDLRMHGMDGLQLIREIKNHKLHINVIIITAYGSGETIKEARDLGVIEFINKPFKLQEIKDGIIRTLSDVQQEKRNGEFPFMAETDEPFLIMDSLKMSDSLSYYFGGPKPQHRNRGVFDFVTISSNQVVTLFGYIHSEIPSSSEWSVNMQAEIIIKTLFRSYSKSTPKRITQRINDFLSMNTSPKVNVSVFCALVDKKENTIRYVNHGVHLVCSVFTPNGQVEIMESNPLLLGVSPDREIYERQVTFSYESRLMVIAGNPLVRTSEKEDFLRKAVFKILNSTKKNKRMHPQDMVLQSLCSDKKWMFFDRETLLLMDLDWDYSASSLQN